jgi:hypothetical protein
MVANWRFALWMPNAPAHKYAKKPFATLLFATRLYFCISSENSLILTQVIKANIRKVSV